MRVVAILLAFAAAFGMAALWQSRRLERMRRDSELAQRLRDGELGQTSSGLVQHGWGVVVVGRPSGVEPLATTGADPGSEGAPSNTTAPASEAESAPPALDPAALADFELTVAPGHSLSEIAKAHYGTAAGTVVDALARYNGLPSADKLVAGQRLLLPPFERLR